MTQAILLKTRPGTHFHFGQVSVDADTALSDTDDHAPSDTLYAALVNVFAEVFPDDVTRFRDAIAGGQLRLSSVFYCMENNARRRFFLPKPAHWDTYLADKSTPYARVRYLSQRAWELGVTPSDLRQRDVADSFFLLHHDTFLAHRSELDADEKTAARSIRFFHKTTLPKVTVSKPQDESRGLFARTVLQIGDNSLLADYRGRLLTPHLHVHFYFLEKTNEQWRKTDLFQKYRTVLDLLPDTGLGGERSTGCGLFDAVEITDFNLNLLSNVPTRPASLSLLAPAAQPDDELSRLLHYRTVLRGGRMTADDGQLRYIRMVAEGAVANKPLNGTIYDISETKNPYWRIGHPLWLDAPYLIQST